MAKEKTAKDLHALTDAELKEMLVKDKEEASHLLMGLRSNDERNHADYRKKRKTIAQINTILSQRS